MADAGIAGADLVKDGARGEDLGARRKPANGWRPERAGGNQVLVILLVAAKGFVFKCEIAVRAGIKPSHWPIIGFGIRYENHLFVPGCRVIAGLRVLFVPVHRLDGRISDGHRPDAGGGENPFARRADGWDEPAESGHRSAHEESGGADQFAAAHL